LHAGEDGAYFADPQRRPAMFFFNPKVVDQNQ
jgi:hypothetical protein